MTTLNINGEEHQVSLDSDIPLLWAIRDLVGYTGTKYGCGKGLCGACMVLIDGNAVNSCQLKAIDAEGLEIITIEGTDPELKRLQESWKQNNVPQCGFCQPGQLITAASLLKRNPKPSEEDIDQNMSRNICRCGTYQRIKNAIITA
jgi:isoquinoline 1-oxidoreductase alpha subunit